MENNPMIVSVTPNGKDTSPQEPILVEFRESMEPTSVHGIVITKNGFAGGPDEGKSIPGQWTASADFRVFTFTPEENYSPGDLIAIRFTSTVRTAAGEALSGERLLYSFLVDDGIRKGTRDIFIPVMKLANNGSHRIPMQITLPAQEGPYPVLFWVHGGAFRGGMPEASGVRPGQQAEYLADRLGVAVVSVAYRCKGSNGNFLQALEDVTDAVAYIRDRASEYGIDMTRVGLYGGSAGTPLSSLVAQRTPEANLYIGYNGLYDLFMLEGSRFTGEDFGILTPSPEANSAALQVKDNPPATLLLHGMEDVVINCVQSVRFTKAIQAKGGYARLLLYEGESHGFFNEGKTMELPTLYEVKEHIKRFWSV